MMAHMWLSEEERLSYIRELRERKAARKLEHKAKRGDSAASAQVEAKKEKERAALEAAQARHRSEEELAARQREQSERYHAQKATREREAELARIAALEEAKGKRPPKDAIVWVREHELPPEVGAPLVIEFGVVGSAALPPSATAVLARLASGAESRQRAS